MASDDEMGRLKRLATIAAVAVAATLVAIKTIAWGMTGSVALLASLFDSALDLLASGLNMIAVRHALEPADHEHRFGHGKAEALAGLGQSAFVTGSAMFLVAESIDRLIDPRPIENGLIGTAVMVVSIALTLALVLFQRSVMRRTASLAIAADQLHYVGDLLTNVAVILAIGLAAGIGWTSADAVGGLVVAAVIAWSAWSIFRASYDQLMDREFDDAERERVRAVALAHPDVRAIHDLRTRTSGSGAFIQFHIELDGAMTLFKAHRISDEVERAVQEAFPHADVIIHQDPEGIEQQTRLERA
ncbi:MAG: cation diffusion facilitator family transporter [Alphaproteobacteria bacterium]|nr:cation diffusion facilitator family transporter [Alphaproteobacteria bacterium]